MIASRYHSGSGPRPVAAGAGRRRERGAAFTMAGSLPEAAVDGVAEAAEQDERAAREPDGAAGFESPRPGRLERRLRGSVEHGLPSAGRSGHRGGGARGLAGARVEAEIEGVVSDGQAVDIHEIAAVEEDRDRRRLGPSASPGRSSVPHPAWTTRCRAAPRSRADDAAVSGNQRRRRKTGCLCRSSMRRRVKSSSSSSTAAQSYQESSESWQ